VVGLIVKSLSGNYTVKFPDKSEVICTARGKFRKDGISPLVGDAAEVNGNVVYEIKPRKNAFIRPPVANVDAMILVASEVIPITDTFVLDTMITIAESKNCEPIIAINKCDISDCDWLYDIYTAAGFTTLKVSALTGLGLDQLYEVLRGKISAFAGYSGVGKSSLLNTLSGLSLKTGEVSRKLGRGRHTTRHTELFELTDDTYIIDTSGFSKIDTDLTPDRLIFREFLPYAEHCRFDDCRHLKEPDCAVISALDSGNILQSRYNSYVRLCEVLDNRTPY